MTTNRSPALVLDARQRAMLQEMGVRVWLPIDRPLLQTAPAVVLRPAPVATPAAFPIAQSTPPILREPPLRPPVLSSPPATLNAMPDRYVIGNMPSEVAVFDFILLGETCTGDAEKLLANMGKALGARVFTAQMVTAQNGAQSLAEQLLNLPAKVIVALGPHSAKALLDEASQGLAFGRLRGAAHALRGLAAKAVITYHPRQLLRQPQAKAQAWADLKLAMREAK